MILRTAIVFAVATLFSCGSQALAANEYLTEVASEVYQAGGTPREIAQRANTCIARNLKPGTTDSQLIINSDLDNGIVVARSAVRYPDGLLQWIARSTFTFEAREGRFRIVQTDLERSDGNGGRWLPIGKWKYSGWLKAQEAFASSAGIVARCVVEGPKRSDW